MDFYKIIKETCENLGHYVTRADESKDQQNIIFYIIDKIYHFDLIIADLTNLNPNVFYELGISHALKKKTIMLTQKIDELPFDLKAYRTIRYSRDYEDIENLKKSLKDIFKNYDNLTFSNPVLDYLTTQGENIKINSKEELKTYEKGVLDYLKEINDSREEIAQIFNSINNETLEFGKKINLYLIEIEKAKKSANPINKIYEIAQNSAKDIYDYSNKINERLLILEKDVNLLELGTLNYLELELKDTSKDINNLIEIKKAFKGEIEASNFLISKLINFQSEISNLKGFHKDLDKSSTILINRLNNLITLIDKIKSIDEKAIFLIDIKLENFNR